jgi:hypothetical protein
MLLEDGLSEMIPFFQIYISDKAISKSENNLFDKFKALALEVEKYKKTGATSG